MSPYWRITNISNACHNEGDNGMRSSAQGARTRLGGGVAQQVGQLGAVGAVLVHSQLDVLPKRLLAPGLIISISEIIDAA